MQEHLFGSRTPAERLRHDPTTGLITREVTRRDPDAPPSVTEIGPWDGRTPLDDMRAAADLTWLQRKTPPSMPTTGDEVRVADLFSGCGAMSLGLAEACRAVGKRFVPVAAFDVEPRVLEVHALNFGGDAPPPTDLSEVLQPLVGAPPSTRETELIERLGRIDFVVAGPPCQGHSNLNNFTRRDDPKNQLYYLVARFVELFRPRWVLIENVVAVLRDKSNVVQRTKDAIASLSGLHGIHYDVVDDIVDLEGIGVAQTRRRHVLVARRNDGGEASGESEPLADVESLVMPYLTRQRWVRWAIEDLLDVSGESPMDAEKQPDQVTQERIDWLFDNDRYELDPMMRPDCHREEFKKSNKLRYGSVYGRMYWDRPAPTITGGFITMGRGRFVHPKRKRTVTAHEAARIQFIPDFFDFSPIHDNRSLLAETIGNAVPPKLSYVLALELLR